MSETPKFVLYSIKHSRPGQNLTFWGRDSAGYVTNIDAAGRYTTADALRIVRDGTDTVEIPEHDLDRFADCRTISADSSHNRETLALIIEERKAARASLTPPELAPGVELDPFLAGIIVGGFMVDFATDLDSVKSALGLARSRGSVGATHKTESAGGVVSAVASVTRLPKPLNA